jgi:hypothetical protein
MSKVKQRLQLKLDNRTLSSRRLGKNGESDEASFEWQIREWSQLPKTIFFLIQGYLKKRINQCYEKDFSTVRIAVVRGLTEAAEACGCKSTKDAKGGDLCWFLDDKPFFSFQIHEGNTDRERAKKLHGRSPILRWVIEIRPTGIPKFKPQKTRRAH